MAGHSASTAVKGPHRGGLSRRGRMLPCNWELLRARRVPSFRPNHLYRAPSLSGREDRGTGVHAFDRFRPRLCENSARDFVWPLSARIFAIFLAMRSDRPRNLGVALAISEFSHSLDPTQTSSATSTRGPLCANGGHSPPGDGRRLFCCRHCRRTIQVDLTLDLTIPQYAVGRSGRSDPVRERHR